MRPLSYWNRGGRREYPLRARRMRMLVILLDCQIALARRDAFGVARDRNGFVGFFLGSDLAAQYHHFPWQDKAPCCELGNALALPSHRAKLRKPA